MRIRSSLRSVGLVDSGACGEHTDQLRDLHAERIDNVSAFERRLAGHDHSRYYRHNYTARGGNRVGACGWRSAGRR